MGGKLLRVVCVASMLAILAPGCESLGGKQDDTMAPAEFLDSPNTGGNTGVVAPTLPQGLALSGQQRFRDIPLPAEAKKDDVASYVYESDSLQIGRMVYDCKATIEELAQFYIQECPAADWERQSVEQADNGASLIFRKPGKRLEVSIRKKGWILRKRVLILKLTPYAMAGGAS